MRQRLLLPSILLVTVVLSALAAMRFAFAAPAKPNSRFTLGVIAPLSGDAASWGNDVRNAVLFANEKFGGNRFSIIFEDDQCRGQDAVTAAHKLTSVNHVDMAMVVCTESMLAAAPVFEKKQTLVIGPATSGAAVSNAGEYIFRTWPSDALAAELLVGYVSAKHNRLGILTEERGYAMELSNSFIKAAAGSSLLLTNKTFSSESTDFRPLLLQLKSQKMDGLLLNANTEGSLAVILRQLHELRWDVPLYGVYTPGNAAFLQLAGPLANGVVFVDAPSADTSLSDEGRALQLEFVKIYGTPQSASFVFPATIEAFRRMVELTTMERKSWRDSLYRGEYAGIFGNYSFDDKGDIEGVRHLIKKIIDGKSQVISAAPLQ